MDTGRSTHPSHQPPARRCLVVSCPLESQRPSPNTNSDWCTIGKGEAVPSLYDVLPIRHHWALCIIPDGEHDFTSPLSQQIFLNAAYFDLGVELSQMACFTLHRLSTSHSHDNVSYNAIWQADTVKSITAILDIGRTTRGDNWIKDRGK